MSEYVKCVDCGFLGQRVRETRLLVDADDYFRTTGDSVAAAMHKHDKLCDPHPVCFARRRNFFKEVPASPQHIKAYINDEIRCPHFQPWQPGIAPQALADMIYQEKLLTEQREWQASQARLADDRHKESLKEVAKATKWNWWAVLTGAGVGALAVLLAGIIGALATLAALWKSA